VRLRPPSTSLGAVRQRKHRAKHRARDREKANRYNAVYRAKHPEAVAQQRERYRKDGMMDAWRYDVPLGWRKAKLKEQEGRCDSCRSPLEISDSVIDHNHRSGKARGVICQFCNRALGQALESPMRLRLLAEYLERYAAD